MNKDLNHSYNLSQIEPWLEVPLDGQVVQEINKYKEIEKEIIRNFTILYLTPDKSENIQAIAQKIALQEEVHRYELDVIFLSRARS